MKKAGSLKFLAAVAIVSSATAMQIRAHVALPDPAAAQPRATMSTCGRANDGITPASCEPMHRERQLERSRAPHDARQLWV
ncbi:hypothetical protein EVC45_12950 [Paraburkholderia sp. UYCP14C]|uniref:hypothetical protein n=1 Tax=Paraburkholderia sp. UYCP14C TaxID=2511130 RepID=UPI00102102FF|nr:hypothetical protein [Paraburkholderia sp. UYCP14C]RZF29357.1 hypothetical protein EVC45_12950 [Paraburkholderia sp. UYCP14C]